MQRLSRTMVLSILVSFSYGSCFGLGPFIVIGTLGGSFGVGTGITVTGVTTGLSLGVGTGVVATGVSTGIGVGTGVATGTGIGVCAGLAGLSAKLGLTGIGAKLGLSSAITGIGTKIGLSSAITGIGTKIGFGNIAKVTGISTVFGVLGNSIIKKKSVSEPLKNLSNSAPSKSPLILIGRAGKCLGYGIGTGLGITLGLGTKLASNGVRLGLGTSIAATGVKLGVGTSIAVIGAKLGLGKTLAGIATKLGLKNTLAMIASKLGLKTCFDTIATRFGWGNLAKVTGIGTLIGTLKLNNSSQKEPADNNSATLNKSAKTNSSQTNNSKIIGSTQSNSESLLSINKPINTLNKQPKDITYTIACNAVEKIMEKMQKKIPQNKNSAPDENIINTLNSCTCAKRSFPNPLSAAIDVIDYISDKVTHLIGMNSNDKALQPNAKATLTSANDRNNQSFVSIVPYVAHRNGDKRQIVRKVNSEGKEFFINLQTDEEVEEGSEAFREQLKKDADDFIEEKRKSAQQQVTKKQSEQLSSQPNQTLTEQKPIQQAPVQQIPAQQSQVQQNLTSIPNTAAMQTTSIKEVLNQPTFSFSLTQPLFNQLISLGLSPYNHINSCMTGAHKQPESIPQKTITPNLLEQKSVQIPVQEMPIQQQQNSTPQNPHQTDSVQQSPIPVQKIEKVQTTSTKDISNQPKLTFAVNQSPFSNNKQCFTLNALQPNPVIPKQPESIQKTVTQNTQPTNSIGDKLIKIPEQQQNPVLFPYQNNPVIRTDHFSNSCLSNFDNNNKDTSTLNTPINQEKQKPSFITPQISNINSRKDSDKPFDLDCLKKALDGHYFSDDKSLKGYLKHLKKQCIKLVQQNPTAKDNDPSVGNTARMETARFTKNLETIRNNYYQSMLLLNDSQEQFTSAEDLYLGNRTIEPLGKYTEQDSLGKRIFEFIAPGISTYTSEVFTEAGVSAAIEPVVTCLFGKTKYQLLKMPYTIVSHIEISKKPFEDLISCSASKLCYGFGANEIQDKMNNILTAGFGKIEHKLFDSPGMDLLVLGKNVSENNSSKLMPRITFAPTYHDKKRYNDIFRKAAPWISDITTELAIDTGIALVSAPLTTFTLAGMASRRLYRIIVTAGIGRGIYHLFGINKLQEMIKTGLSHRFEIAVDDFPDRSTELTCLATLGIKMLNKKRLDITPSLNNNIMKLRKFLPKDKCHIL